MLLVIFWFGIISIFSSVPKTSLPEMPSDLWHFVAHRMAHVVEYSILGALVLRAYAQRKNKITVATILYLSLFILLAGTIDEWHQSYVPGRQGQLIDVIFDTICGTWGMWVYFKWMKRLPIR